MITLRHLFALVCGQAHVWNVGGHTLPLCQRCTGLYAGAAVALLLWLMFRPRPTPGRLWAHGLALLLMVPFGYHLVPQAGEVRTLTGFVFAIGLVYFLLLVPAVWLRLRLSEHARGYLAGMFAAAPALMIAIHFGGAVAAMVLSGLSVAGLAALALLSAANLLLIPLSLRRATAS